MRTSFEEGKRRKAETVNDNVADGPARLGRKERGEEVQVSRKSGVFRKVSSAVHDGLAAALRSGRKSTILGFTRKTLIFMNGCSVGR